ncbi:Hypothetical_protein [Hexamita inflata]|uniref:Hypothetical_protein n=1 Tax=Hexamita inflata TaxID=28002 RepID=A0AA86PLB5_9EUKA|nr:Hypothetical protein HINF_LOCUS28256 [Hexamita inflata]
MVTWFFTGGHATLLPQFGLKVSLNVNIQHKLIEVIKIYIQKYNNESSLREDSSFLCTYLFREVASFLQFLLIFVPIEDVALFFQLLLWNVHQLLNRSIFVQVLVNERAVVHLTLFDVDAQIKIGFRSHIMEP